MPITPPLRPQEDGSAEADRSDVLRQAAPIRTAAFTAIVACAFLLIVTLVGLGQLDSSEPGFLSDALGPEESGAPLERTPAPGVGVRIHSEGYTVSRWGDSVSVVGEDVGGAELRRELGFGLLVAAFSIGVAAVLRARRPLGQAADVADQELLWDARLLRSVGRFLRRLTGRR